MTAPAKTRTKHPRVTPEALATAREHYRQPEIEGQDAPEDAPEPTQPNKGRSVVYSVRLSPEEVTEIERLAEERDIGASTLVRGYILKGLAETREAQTPAAILARMRRDMDELRAVVGLDRQSRRAEQSEPDSLGAEVTPLGELHELVQSRADRTRLADVVRRAREAGSSWRVIGLALGTSASTARQRYGQQPKTSASGSAKIAARSGRKYTGRAAVSGRYSSTGRAAGVAKNSTTTKAKKSS